MQALVLHTWLDQLGGAEQVAINAACALAERGYEVHVVKAGRGKACLKALARCCGAHLDKIVTHYVELPVSPTRPFTTYKRLLTGFLVGLKSRRLDLSPDLTLVTSNHSECLAVEADILYVHFPQLAFEYRASGLKRRAYLLLAREVERASLRARLVIANSRFTASMLENLYGVKARVLYPPVDVERFERHRVPERRRKPWIVTVGRIEPSKRLHLMLLLARMFPSYRFVIVGRRVVGYDYYLAELLRKRPPNLTLLTDVGDEEVAEIVCSSMLYVHLMPHEHFGIAPFEALACEVPALVHVGSGASELLPRELTWRSLRDLVATIAALDKNYDDLARLARECREVARNLSPERFRERFLSLLDQLREKPG